MPGGDEIFLDQTNVRPFLPTVATPKLLSVDIVVVKKDIALNESEPLQLRQALFHEARAKAVPAICRRDRKVM